LPKGGEREKDTRANLLVLVDALQGKTVGELIEVLLKEVDFEKHWKDDKWEDRLENIMELVRLLLCVLYLSRRWTLS